MLSGVNVPLSSQICRAHKLAIHVSSVCNKAGERAATAVKHGNAPGGIRLTNYGNAKLASFLFYVANDGNLRCNFYGDSFVRGACAALKVVRSCHFVITPQNIKLIPSCINKAMINVRAWGSSQRGLGDLRGRKAVHCAAATASRSCP